MVHNFYLFCAFAIRAATETGDTVAATDEIMLINSGLLDYRNMLSELVQVMNNIFFHQLS